MRNPAAWVVMALSLCVASCGGNGQPSGDNRAAGVGSGQPPVSASAPRRPVQPGQASGRKPPSPARVAEDTPPSDAQFMIFCEVIRGPGHVQRILELKRELIQDTKRQGWHVIHSADESSIYFGYYTTFEDAGRDPHEVARAQNDRKYIESLRDPLGDRRFKNSMFVPVSSPDPEAPSEWNLAATPAGAFWSVQVAAYKGSPERKKFAIDLVRAMRAHGENAYYYHGDTISSVCVGVWPRSAVKEQDVRDDAHSTDPSQTLLVLGDKAPQGINANARDKDGKRMLILAPKLEILDQTLQDAIKKYPYHAVNGEYQGKVANGEVIPDPSFLVQIPHEAYAASGSPADDHADSAVDAVRAGANDAAAAILDQRPPEPRQQPARLRTIGDR